MPKISTFLTALTLTLAFGLLAWPGNAQAGHKSNGHGKGGGYERHSSGHHKVKRDDDRDDRKGGHAYRKFGRGDDDDGHRRGHKHGHKKSHKKGHKYGHGQGHGHRYAKHHDAKRHGHHKFHGQGFRAHHGGNFGKLQAGLHGGYGGCHKISKVGYRHRQKALIGGTACYDRYGNFYIVDGSRYIIRYLSDWR